MKSNVEMAEIILSDYRYHLKMRANYAMDYRKAIEEGKKGKAKFAESRERRHIRAYINLQLLMDELEIEYVGYSEYIANSKNKTK